MLAAIKVNQWKNTSSIFEWFKNIDRKETCLFSKFDTESFYHSISVRIINKATDSRKKFVFFSNDDIFIIIKTRKTLVFHEQAPWIEKTGNKNFDVPMGWFDGGEVCKLLSSYILRKLKVIMKKKKHRALLRQWFWIFLHSLWSWGWQKMETNIRAIKTVWTTYHSWDKY